MSVFYEGVSAIQILLACHYAVNKDFVQAGIAVGLAIALILWSISVTLNGILKEVRK